MRFKVRRGPLNHADTRPETSAFKMPEGEGLEAIARGFAILTGDDHQKLEWELPMYDALLAFCRRELLVVRSVAKRGAGTSNERRRHLVNFDSALRARGSFAEPFSVQTRQRRPPVASGFGRPSRRPLQMTGN